MKQLKHASKTFAKTLEKHTQHPDKTLVTFVWNICNIQINTLATYIWKNRWNIRNRSLQHTCTNIATYATSWSTYATSAWHTCNIPLKPLKHLKHTLLPIVVSSADRGRCCPSRRRSSPGGMVHDVAATGERWVGCGGGSHSGEPEWGGTVREWGGRIDARCRKSMQRASKLGDIFEREKYGRRIARQSCWASTVAHRPGRWRPVGQMPAPEHYRFLFK